MVKSGSITVVFCYDSSHPLEFAWLLHCARQHRFASSTNRSKTCLAHMLITIGGTFRGITEKKNVNVAHDDYIHPTIFTITIIAG